MSERVMVSMVDADSGEEIEGIDFPHTPAIPRAGERVHWWEDRFPPKPGLEPRAARDFEIVKVEHDWRYMTGDSRTYVQVVLHVREVKEAS